VALVRLLVPFLESQILLVAFLLLRKAQDE
jgi:hypothetical protein